MVDMSKIHYHVNQRMDGGPPHALRTDREAATPHMALDDLRAILPRLGYDLLEAEITAHGQHLVFLDPETRTWSFTMWACACESGEAEIAARNSAAYIGSLGISPN